MMGFNFDCLLPIKHIDIDHLKWMTLHFFSFTEVLEDTKRIATNNFSLGNHRWAEGLGMGLL